MQDRHSFAMASQVTVEATTTWLKEEVAQVPALQGLEVAVATKSVALSLSAEAAEPLKSSITFCFPS